ncbi:Two-component response regulator, AmiR/NasT family, consists of REC and RNA-binding antiterminator (ANTAR) domains [Rhizobium sp. NFR07]|uniref:ANTAR domain-containing response regulator n=1 Tax=Rhizobium sp. NFR07 TaxID=1566262 RepID=UPI0008EE78AE|nr:ANTAR domain-containing protein [Rhizobium sp. NFR07]SFB14590.1 Two-component response regulator, AmiR/NasT family, consists of REC and RNA-binding antiterminator (ANTAR) domains [Rhizobium sp. NFR07]
MSRTPNFTGWRAVILHREDSNTERLERQFGLLGIRATRRWEPLSTWADADLVLVDADQGWDDLLPQADGVSGKPLVALLGSEAPGRIAWAMKQGASAIIPKPVAASAIFPALVMAVSIHEERQAAADKLRHLEERIRMRPLVHAAVEKLRAARGLTEDEAYATLRGCAMQRRLTMEEVAAMLLGGAEALPEVG